MQGRPTSQRALQALLVVFLLSVLLFVSLLRSAYRLPTPGEELSFTELSRIATNGLITSAAVLEEDARIVGTRCVPRTGVQPPTSVPAGTVPCAGVRADFHADYPRSEVVAQQLVQNITRGGAPLTVDNQNGKATGRLLVTFTLPLAMLASVFGLIFLARGGDSSLADIAGLGTVSRKRKRSAAPTTDVTFADVAGADEAIAELRDVTRYLANPSKFATFGGAPRRVLLSGPPGCGKTLLARAVGGESKVPFFSVSGIELLDHDGAARVRDLFRRARGVAPAIVFVDELDAPGRRREGESTSGGEGEQTLNQLMVEMDGREGPTGVVLIGATSRPDLLDPALLRPGRLDRHVRLSAPDASGRKSILQVHAKSRLMAPDVDFAELAARTPGLTGADLASVLNEAALLALGENSDGDITATHVSAALQGVLDGPHQGELVSAEGRQRIAFHRAGHAVVAAAFGKNSELTRVSIVGRPSCTEGSDPVLRPADEVEAQLAVAMGGIAAEQLHFGRISTAAEDDIDNATGLARQMAGRYGMSAQLGRVRVKDGYAISERTRQEFEDEVKRLITTAEQRATAVLQAQRAQLKSMAGRLEEVETLSGAAVRALVASVKDRTDMLRNGSVRPAPPPPAKRQRAKPKTVEGKRDEGRGPQMRSDTEQGDPSGE